jgi:sulfate transport system permease protein
LLRGGYRGSAQPRLRRRRRLAIAKFEFKGKAFLTTLIDLPFSVSPVISGLSMCCCSAPALLRSLAHSHGIRSSSPCAGIVLATIFVTFPFVRPRADPADAGAGHRSEEARARRSAPAAGRPSGRDAANIEWGLLYGVLLCNARAMGEFGAVSVVSGHIRGLTTPCRCMSRSSTTSTTPPAPSRCASLLAGLGAGHAWG